MIAALLLAAVVDLPAITGLTHPTAVRFSPDGRVVVAEKSGLVKIFDSLSDTTPEIAADLRGSVYDYWDRGLLGLALDPDFPSTPWIYVLYTWDVDGRGDACPTPPGPTAEGCLANGRLSRFVPGGPEEILAEGRWCQQFPSHSVGALAFGADGALYLSAGEGASFVFADRGQAGNPCGDPETEGGALRAQDLRTPSDPLGWSGAIVRFDVASREGAIVAHGFRNPYRWAFRPGTSEIWVADVGWSAYEEIDRIEDPAGPVGNYGWPCYEGPTRQPLYDALDVPVCEALYAEGSSLRPYYAYGYSETITPGGDACPTGSSSIAGIAFRDGSLYFADYARQCVYVVDPGIGGLPDVATRRALAAVRHPVDLQPGPGDDLFYVDFDGGAVRRLTFHEGNTPPVAAVRADPVGGPLPLEVTFDASDSEDVDPGAVLTFAWDLDGDGAFDDATGVTVRRSYASAGPVTVSVRATDDRGASSTASVLVIPGDTPPEVALASPDPALPWSVGDVLSFAASATDAEDGAIPASSMGWSVVLHHCPGGLGTCHEHVVEEHEGVASGEFVAPDHSWYAELEFRVRVRDSAGLVVERSVTVPPRVVSLSIESDPPGLRLSAGEGEGTTPFAVPAIAGSTVTLAAPELARGETGRYGFVSWSDGGAPAHEIVAGESSSFGAVYRECTYEIANGLDDDCNGVVDDAREPSRHSGGRGSRTPGHP